MEPISRSQAIEQPHICEVTYTEDKDEVIFLLTTGEWINLGSSQREPRLFSLGRVRGAGNTAEDAPPQTGVKGRNDTMKSEAIATIEMLIFKRLEFLEQNIFTHAISADKVPEAGTKLVSFKKEQERLLRTKAEFEAHFQIQAEPDTLAPKAVPEEDTQERLTDEQLKSLYDNPNNFIVNWATKFLFHPDASIQLKTLKLLSEFIRY